MMPNDDDRVPWAAFLAGFDWRQGEHVSVIGPTGSGKSVLARAIAPRRSYVCVLATKPEDSTLTGYRRDGYAIARRWPPPLPRRVALRSNGAPDSWRVLLWPRFRQPSDVARQRVVFGDALDAMFVERRWTIIADEVRYLCANLGLQRAIELVWLQGRSLGLSLVAGTQRPAWVPLEMYSQADHLFFWRDNDERNLRTIGGLGGMSAKAIREKVATLAKHDALYVNTRDGTTAVTRVERQ